MAAKIIDFKAKRLELQTKKKREKLGKAEPELDFEQILDTVEEDLQQKKDNEEGYDFAQVMEENQKKKDRMNSHRSKANDSVKKSYRLYKKKKEQ